MDKENTRIGAICDKFIKWGLYVFAFLLPLFFLPFNSNVVEMNKQLLLVAFALLLLVAWLGKIIARGRLEFKKSLLNLGVILFLIAYLVSTCLSKNIYAGLVGSAGTVSEAFFTVLSLAIVFFVIVNNLKSKKEIQSLLFSLTLSGFVAGLFAVLQLAGKFILPWDFAQVINFNTIGSVNSLEIMLAALLILCAVLFAESETGKGRQIFFGAAAGLFLLMILSVNFSNVWWGLLAASMVVIALGIINREQMSQYRLILPMVILAFSVLMLLTNIGIFSNWLSIPTEVSPSYGATLDINQQVLKNDLFFGTGPGSFASDYGLYRSESLNETVFWNIRFNQGISKVFSLPATLGIFGLLMWLATVIGFAVYGFLKLVRHRGKNWALALGAFSAWLFMAVLQFLYTTNLTLEFVFWALLAVAFLSIKTLRPAEEERGDDFSKIESMDIKFDRTSPLASILSFVIVIILVLTISAFYLGGSYYWADVLYQRGLQAVATKNDLDNGSKLISRAVLLNPYNDLYLRSLSQAALLRVNQELQKEQSAERDSNIQNLIATAINIAKRSTELSPGNVDNWEQLGVIYRAVMPYTAGADQWAFDSFKQASKLEPQNPFYHYELGLSYITAARTVASLVQQDDKEAEAKVNDYLVKAEEALARSVAVKSDYSPALYQLALVYDYQGKLDQAIAKMKIARDLNSQDVGVAFQLGLLYYKQPDLNSARAEFERAVMLDQNYSNALYFLGLVYDKQGDKARAKEQFEKVAKLNPDNQEVKTILSNLNAGKAALPEPTNLPIDEKVPKNQ